MNGLRIFKITFFIIIILSKKCGFQAAQSEISNSVTQNINALPSPEVDIHFSKTPRQLMILNNAYSITETTQFAGIKNSLLQLYSFANEQLNHFTQRLTFKKLEKRDFLLKPNQISSCLAFINTGSLRFYTNTERGELTINFFTENQWVADIESFLIQQPSKNYIEAFDPTDISFISLRDIHELMDLYPCFRMLNAIIANLVIPTTHLATISTKSPDERYKQLLLKHPDWINRFPQMQIASYLGMTPETLSRVRSRVA